MWSTASSSKWFVSYDTKRVANFENTYFMNSWYLTIIDIRGYATIVANPFWNPTIVANPYRNPNVWSIHMDVTKSKNLKMSVRKMIKSACEIIFPRCQYTRLTCTRGTKTYVKQRFQLEVIDQLWYQTCCKLWELISHERWIFDGYDDRGEMYVTKSCMLKC